MSLKRTFAAAAILAMVASAQVFAEDAYQIIFGENPNSQAEIPCLHMALSDRPDCRDKRYEESRQELKAALIAYLSGLGPIQKRRFLESQRAWVSMRQAQCDSLSSGAPGSGEASAECLTATTSRRAEEIQSLSAMRR